MMGAATQKRPPAYRFTGDAPPPALAHLRGERKWVGWRYEWRDNRWTKPPIDPATGRKAKSNDPATWGTFDDALAAVERYGLAGVGVTLAEGDGLCGADLDHCITDSGSFSPLAARLVEMAETYTEVSPSGEGLRIFIAGKASQTFKLPHVEIYNSGRYLTVTGDQVEGSPSELREASRTLALLAAERPARTKGRAATPLPQSGEAHRVREALRAVPAEDYDSWIRVGMALMAGLGEAGFALWREWSMSSAKFDEGACRTHWRSFKPEGGVSIATVFGLARDHGWREEPRTRRRGARDEEPAVEATKPAYAGPSCTIDEVIALFQRWLYLPDPGPVYATLGTVRANLLPGRPVWLGLVGPPSSAKTEIINALSLLPYVHPATALSPAALLSGTPKKQRAQDAKGGLLRQIGEHGIITQKDLGSVLSARPDDRAEAFAALRELYDGAWTRDLGTDGGRQLKWKGKVGLIVGSTEAVDSHADSMAQLGERLVFYRLDGGGMQQLDYALLQAGDGAQRMERELREAVAGLFKDTSYVADPATAEEIATLKAISWRAVQLRSAVVRDRRTREIEAVHKTEGPARLFLMLERMFIGIASLEADRATAMAVVRRVAMDSVPPMRRKALEFIEAAGKPQETGDVARLLGLATLQTRRVLEDLAARQLVIRESQGAGKSDVWGLPREPNPQNTLWGSREVLDAAE
jgi:hypothetical protein